MTNTTQETAVSYGINLRNQNTQDVISVFAADAAELAQVQADAARQGLEVRDVVEMTAEQFEEQTADEA